MEKSKQRNKGITLVALAITIIVLLILAGITINLTIGEDGIIKRSQEAGKNYIQAAENEKLLLGQFTNEMNNIIGGNGNSGSVDNGRTPYNSEFRKNVVAAINGQGVETIETDTDEVIIENIGKIFEERTKLDDEVAVIADNITQGKQAYVNGQLVTGNGADNQAHYEDGYRTGYSEGVAESLSKANIVYTYHAHEGSSSTEGGCYTKAVYHKHVDSCYNTCPGPRNMTYDDATTRHFVCVKCGSGWYMDVNLAREHGVTSVACGVKLNTTKCGISTSTPIEYDLSCGKTTSTIESATIVY